LLATVGAWPPADVRGIGVTRGAAAGGRLVRGGGVAGVVVVRSTTVADTTVAVPTVAGGGPAPHSATEPGLLRPAPHIEGPYAPTTHLRRHAPLLPPRHHAEREHERGQRGRGDRTPRTGRHGHHRQRRAGCRRHHVQVRPAEHRRHLVRHHITHEPTTHGGHD